MRTHKFNLSRLTYTIDFPVVLLFLAVSLDVISTFLFVELNVGTEANVILRDLISISVWFIPLYLLTTNAFFVPFLNNVLRKTFSYTFGLVSLLLGLNNFSLIIFNNAFLVEAFGFESLVGLFVLTGLAIFAWFVKKEKMNKKQVITTCLNLLLFGLFLILIQFIFSVIPVLNNFFEKM